MPAGVLAENVKPSSPLILPSVGHVTVMTFDRMETRSRHNNRRAAAAAAEWKNNRGRPKICVSPAGAVRRERTEGRGQRWRRHRVPFRQLLWLDRRRPGGKVAPTSLMRGRCAQHGWHSLFSIALEPPAATAIDAAVTATAAAA